MVIHQALAPAATTIQQAIASRVSIHAFAPGHALADADIEQLVQQATQAPTAFNFQNWRFVAVRSPAAKQRLRAVAYGQQKVEDAAVVFIICGSLQAHRRLAEVLQPSVDDGIIALDVADALVNAAHAVHEGNAAVQRDEAIRSASLAAMTLMLAAQGRGWVSCAMSGFDPQGVSQAFALGAEEVPVVLVAVGHAATADERQKRRRPLADVLELV